MKQMAMPKKMTKKKKPQKKNVTFVSSIYRITFLDFKKKAINNSRGYFLEI